MRSRSLAVRADADSPKAREGAELLQRMTFPQATTLLRRAVLWLGGVSVPAAGLFAAEVAKEDTAFFDEKIHPILKERCYECHSHEAGKTKGGLALDSRSGWSEGGGSGPAVAPG